MRPNTQHSKEALIDDDVVVVVDPRRHAGVLALFGLGVADIKDSLDKQVRDKNIASKIHLLGSKTSTEFAGGSQVLAPNIRDTPRLHGAKAARPDVVADDTYEKTTDTTKLTCSNARNLRKKTKIIERKILANMNKKQETVGALTFGQERRRARLLRVMTKIDAIIRGANGKQPA